VAHQQAAAEAAQVGIELEHAGVDEADPAVVARQRIEDVAVEYEGAVSLAGRGQRAVERGMVETAQVAPEPDQGLAYFHHCVRGQCTEAIYRYHGR
jgi:hypothetical protein